MSLAIQLRRHLHWLLVMLAMFVLALIVSVYITRHERLRFPWEHPTQIWAEFQEAQAVTPGQGQTVDEAGVTVGEIGQVKLENGIALVRLDITKEKEVGPIYRNATALMRPKTGLKDMSVALDPGRPDRSLPNGGRLKNGDHIPLANTAPDVNSDEVLGSLDLDTRNYLKAFVAAGGQGLKGRGPQLRQIIRASQPTLAETNRVMSAIADRRTKVTRLVTNLRRLSEVAASKDQQLASLVKGSAAAFSTIGDREAALGDSVARLPGALSATNDALVQARPFAEQLRPALTKINPAIRRLVPALKGIRPLFRDATPVVRDQVRPLVRALVPVATDLRPSLVNLNHTVPALVRVASVLNYVANELGYNPPGPEEGYLFWLAWNVHSSNSILSIEDANGATWRGLVMVGCSTASAVIAANPSLAPLGEAPLCGHADQAKMKAAADQALAKQRRVEAKRR
jgi:phospholipid/cholesterol/gamma-HCH transport system substrate-binding protein